MPEMQIIITINSEDKSATIQATCENGDLFDHILADSLGSIIQSRLIEDHKLAGQIAKHAVRNCMPEVEEHIGGYDDEDNDEDNDEDE